MTLEEIKKALAEQHEAFQQEGFSPRRGIYTVICTYVNGHVHCESTRLPKKFCEHPEQLRELVRDHNGERVICFFPNKEAASHDDLRHAARVPLRKLAKMELGHF